MDNQNSPPNPTPPIENVPAQKPAVGETPSSQVYTAPHIENPPPPKKPFMFSKILLPMMIIMVLLAATAGTYLALNAKSKQASKVTPTPLPTEASAKAGTSADETANWKTYEDSTYGFSLKYPSDWRIIEEKSILTFSDTKTPVGEKPALISVHIFETAKIAPQWQKNYTPFTYKEFVKGDKTFILMATTYQIGSSASKETEESAKNVLEKIIPTFKFLDSTEPVACTQEVKLCPDGSYVGREGPDCEFASCPAQ